VILVRLVVKILSPLWNRTLINQVGDLSSGNVSTIPAKSFA